MADSINKLRVGITKRYGGKTVLDHLSLEIRGGEFVTFLGPSGCGKSTALGIIAGLGPADRRRNLARRSTHRRRSPAGKGAFGMVFQNYALFPHLTVFDNVAFGLSLQRRPAAEIKERVGTMLGLVRLSGYEERYPGQLSGGQQQRVAIARALVLHPRLMLFDEPLSNLDAKLRVEMRAEIKQLHARLGLTSISYVTHDQAEALSLSDRIVVLRDGLLMQVGTPQEIHDRPANVFVADFMGFRNFFDVELGEGAGGGIEGVAKGRRLRARANGFASSGNAVMAIRPDDIRVGAAPDGQNVMRGKSPNSSNISAASLRPPLWRTARRGSGYAPRKSSRWAIPSM